MASSLAHLRQDLKAHADPARAAYLPQFFQAHKGGYGEGDRFLGVRVPDSRAIAKRFRDLSTQDLEDLVRSPLHEERQVGLFILVDRHRRAAPHEKLGWARSYLRLRKTINNWDLIDTSAPHVLGPHLDEIGDTVLLRLAKSASVWDRRISMLATQHEIHERRFDRALRLARLLLRDEHDLMHKAVGWMLREIGERDGAVLRRFLDRHGPKMPRTMLRYAIEKLPSTERRAYLAKPH